MMENHLYFVTGTIELESYPDTPQNDFPSKKDCAGYSFISMVQLSNITEKKGLGRKKACDAFGGDKGIKYPIIPERQPREWKKGGHPRRKFVLVSAVEKYFQEIGLEWD